MFKMIIVVIGLAHIMCFSTSLLCRLTTDFRKKCLEMCGREILVLNFIMIFVDILGSFFQIGSLVNMLLILDFVIVLSSKRYWHLIQRHPFMNSIILIPTIIAVVMNIRIVITALF